jgi:hypothetical protein
MSRFDGATPRGATIKQAYTDWLKSYNWDYFFTTTFRSARREPYYAAKHLWTELKKFNVGRSFVGVEPHQSGELHCHGLIAGVAPGWKPELCLPWDIWNGLFKRFGRSKVEACNSQEAVTGYCAKYILKQQSRVCDYYYVFGDALWWKLGKITGHSIRVE